VKASPEQLVALRTVAEHLGSLRDEVVFLGGMVTGLLVTDSGAPIVRSTDDIDLMRVGIIIHETGWRRG
jgi:hypothetical protein